MIFIHILKLKHFIFVLCFSFTGLIISSCDSSQESAPKKELNKAKAEPKSTSIQLDLAIRERLCIDTPMLYGSSKAALVRRDFLVKALKEANVKWLRHDIHWSRVEKSKGVFDFSEVEKAVNEANKQQINLFMLLGYGNPWASSKSKTDDKFPPDDPKDFANFVRKTVQHFKEDIKRWEIWNEPNAGYRFWKTAPLGDPVAYAALLREAAIAAREADSDALVAFGAPFFYKQLIMGGIEFTEKAFKAQPDLKNIIQRMAVHPYDMYPPSEEPESLKEKRVSFRQKLKQTAAFLGKKPFWVTEIGWPVYGRVSQEKQAEYLARSYLHSFAEGAELVCWFNFADRKNFKEFPPEDAFGLFSYSEDWQKEQPIAKPSYKALKTIGVLLGDANMVEDVSKSWLLKDGEFALKLSSKEKTYLAFWRSENTEARNIFLTENYSNPVQLVSMVGEKLEFKNQQANKYIELDTSPKYLVFNVGK